MVFLALLVPKAQTEMSLTSKKVRASNGRDEFYSMQLCLF